MTHFDMNMKIFNFESRKINTLCFEIDDQSNTLNNDLCDPIRHSKNIQ